MRIGILLFGGAAQLAGADRVEVSVPSGARSEEVLVAIGTAVPALRAVLPAARLAVNHDFAAPTQEIREGDEVALIAMVSGG